MILITLRRRSTPSPITGLPHFALADATQRPARRSWETLGEHLRREDDDVGSGDSARELRPRGAPAHDEPNALEGQLHDIWPATR